MPKNTNYGPVMKLLHEMNSKYRKKGENKKQKQNWKAIASKFQKKESESESEEEDDEEEENDSEEELDQDVHETEAVRWAKEMSKKLLMIDFQEIPIDASLVFSEKEDMGKPLLLVTIFGRMTVINYTHTEFTFLQELLLIIFGNNMSPKNVSFKEWIWGNLKNFVGAKKKMRKNIGGR